MVLMEVDETQKLDALKFNGVLGLSPNNQHINTVDGVQSISFIDNLYSDGLIDSRVFSLYLADDANYRNVSMLTVGGYDVERFAYNQTVTWNDVTYTTWWTLNLKKAEVGDIFIDTSTKNAIIDSGTSYLAMPDKDLKSLVTLLTSVHDFDCDYSD